MEELRNENLEVLEVEETEADDSVVVYEPEVDEVSLVSEDKSSNLLVLGTGLAIAAVTGAVLFKKRYDAKKREQIENEAEAKIEEILKSNGHSDEQVEEYMKTYRENRQKERDDSKKDKVIKGINFGKKKAK